LEIDQHPERPAASLRLRMNQDDSREHSIHRHPPLLNLGRHAARRGGEPAAQGMRFLRLRIPFPRGLIVATQGFDG